MFKGLLWTIMRAHNRKHEWVTLHNKRNLHKLPCINYNSCSEKSLPCANHSSITKHEGREALNIYEKIREDGVKPDIYVFLAALKACSNSKNLQIGLIIHAHAILTGAVTNILVCNTLLHMYAKCGSRFSCHSVFDRMPHPNVISWNALIFGYILSGECEFALCLFAHMQNEGFAPAARTYVAALKACASCAAKEEGMQANHKFVNEVFLEKGIAIHSQLSGRGYELDIFVTSTLMDMYAKCGSMVHALRVFDRIQQPDLVSWNALLFGYQENGESEKALQLFEQMQHSGSTPNARTYVAALKACAGSAAKEVGKPVQRKLVRLECLEKGVAIHSQLAKNRYESDTFVASALVDMYAKCGSMVHAHQVFESLPSHDVVLWSALIFGYTESGEGKVALQLFACMQDEGFEPDTRTYHVALTACASCAEQDDIKQNGRFAGNKYLENGISIHSQLVKKGYELNIFIASILVVMYAKCGSMVHAHQVFDRMPHHDLVAWSAVIFGYLEIGESVLALELYANMQGQGFTPDAQIYIAALKACGNCAVNEEGKQLTGTYVKIDCLERAISIHGQLAKAGYEEDFSVATSLVDIYAKCGSMIHARQVFDKMSHHDLVCWSALLFGYIESGESSLTLQLFDYMQDQGFTPDAQTYVAALRGCAICAAGDDIKKVSQGLAKKQWLEKGIAIHSQVKQSRYETGVFMASALVDMYAKCGSPAHAHHVFNTATHCDVVLFTAMMFGHIESGDGEVALQLFRDMQGEGLSPSPLTYVAAIKACSLLGALETGKTTHNQIYRAGLHIDAVMASSLIGLYGKCGSMIDAQNIFDSMSSRGLVIWNALLAGYAHQGDSKQVFDLFERMGKEGTQANANTFLSILTACSHAGLVGSGREYFRIMCLHHLITPSIEHYMCMVDLLGRANHLDDAVAVVKNMPYEPDLAIWKTLLSACWKWKNEAIGRCCFDSILNLDDKDASAYVLMANIYAMSRIKDTPIIGVMVEKQAKVLFV